MHKPPQRTGTQASAGGVLYREHTQGIEICLIAKHEGRVWALPKGRLGPGETPTETAVREVLEETGHRGEIVQVIGETQYDFLWREENTLYHKTVTYYLMRCVAENVQVRDTEADTVEWTSLNQALERLHYDNEKGIVEQAQGVLKSVMARLRPT